MAILFYTVLSVFFATVLADSSQQNPLIPSNITPSCLDFLSSFDKNSDFSSCLNPIQTALKQYLPGGSSPSDSSTATSALDSLCAANLASSCPDTTLSTQLTSFYSACSKELTVSPNLDVMRMYDSLYVLGPLRNAMCSKDDSGKYCATELGSSCSSSAGKGDLVNRQYKGSIKRANNLIHRDNSSYTEYIPNMDQFCKLNLAMFFYTPSMDESKLCTSCVRNVITSFITFESKYPYAPGFNSSKILCGQRALYNAIESTCGSSFLGGAVQAAGGLSSGTLSGAVGRLFSQDVTMVVSAVLGAAGLVVAF